MDTSDSLMVAGTVVLLTEVIKFSKHVPDSAGVYVVMLLSLASVFLWAWSGEGILVRTNAFGLFTGWVTVVATAAGVYGFVREMRTDVMGARRLPDKRLDEGTRFPEEKV